MKPSLDACACSAKLRMLHSSRCYQLAQRGKIAAHTGFASHVAAPTFRGAAEAPHILKTYVLRSVKRGSLDLNHPGPFHFVTADGSIAREDLTQTERSFPSSEPYMGTKFGPRSRRRGRRGWGRRVLRSRPEMPGSRSTDHGDRNNHNSR